MFHQKNNLSTRELKCKCSPFCHYTAPHPKLESSGERCVSLSGQGLWLPLFGTWQPGTAVSLCPQGGCEGGLARKPFAGPPDSNYNPRGVVGKGGVWKKGSFSRSLKRNWVKLKITYSFKILKQSLSRKCRKQGSFLPQFLELLQLEVSPTHKCQALNGS